MDEYTEELKNMKFRVSTITAVGDVGSTLSLVQIFKHIPLDRPEGSGTSFVSVKMGNLTRSWIDDVPIHSDDPVANVIEPELRLCGLELTEDDAMSRCTSKSRDHFGNQVTLVVSIEGTRINLKAFKNGRVQLTGVKQIDQGFRAIEHLVTVVKKSEHVGDICADPDKLSAGGYRVCMINSDLDLGFPVKRDRLFSFVRESYPDILCTYEPCNYHGVKFKYMWNSAVNEMEGVCRCGSGICAGNSDGSEEGKCRKVTVAVFQSGKVIATGAQTMKQLEDALRFLVKDVCRQEHRRTFSLGPVGPQQKLHQNL
jgi:TATA-box binding protein (TBP) (component of TFIID and TFIIIB)